MAAKKKPKRKAKRIKYYKVAFKLTGNQKKTAELYTKVHKTTLNKLIKKSLKFYLDRFGDKLPVEQTHISKNQLELF